MYRRALGGRHKGPQQVTRILDIGMANPIAVSKATAATRDAASQAPGWPVRATMAGRLFVFANDHKGAYWNNWRSITLTVER